MSISFCCLWELHKNFGNLNHFNTTVNGESFAMNSMTIDPFSVPNETVLHYLVNKNEIIKLAKEESSKNKANIGQTIFTLSPVT
jgi:hypothetical protein